jgi:glutathione peroxidase
MTLIKSLKSVIARLRCLFYGGFKLRDALQDCPSILSLTISGKGGQSFDFGAYRGQVLLIVNTASKCGFTRQYDELEELYNRYRGEGLVVLGFPSNDFLGQEPGSDSEIESFCRVNFGVTFPLFPKGCVRGAEIQPLFKLLTTNGPWELRGAVLWNFEKFLIDREGYLVGRWRSWVSPGSRGFNAAIRGVLKSV